MSEPKVTECWARVGIEGDILLGHAGSPLMELVKCVVVQSEDYDALIIMRDNFLEAVEAATPYFQSGGRFAHLLRPGDSILKDGIPALVKEFDAMRKELEELRKYKQDREEYDIYKREKKQKELMNRFWGLEEKWDGSKE